MTEKIGEYKVGKYEIQELVWNSKDSEELYQIEQLVFLNYNNNVYK